jgi:hypothetical protein
MAPTTGSPGEVEIKTLPATSDCGSKMALELQFAV